MTTTITATASNVHRSYRSSSPSSVDIDVSILISIDDAPIMLLSGSVTMTIRDGEIVTLGGAHATPEDWVSPQLCTDLYILQTEDHMRAVAELRRVAIEAAKNRKRP